MYIYLITNLINNKKYVDKPDHSGSNNGRAKVTEEDVKKLES